MKTVKADVFGPICGPSKTTITIEVDAGLIDAPAGTLVAGAALLCSVNSGESHKCALQILDEEHYTSFALTVPEHVAPGAYVYTFVLKASDGRDAWEVGSHSQMVFYVTSSEEPAAVHKIEPARVRRSELATTTFTITGKSLDRLDRTQLPKIDCNPDVRLSLLHVTPETAKLKVLHLVDFESIQPGKCRVEFYDFFELNGVFAKNTITIEE